jgi:hypothetical protein
MLSQYWSEVRTRAEQGDNSNYVEGRFFEIIRDSVGDETDKSYRYVAITQLLAKIVDPSLDCRSLQESAAISGAFDPRGFCKKVVVPFEREQFHGVLGRSPDPYVSNPLRVPLLAKGGRAPKSDAEMWDKLCELTEAVQVRRDAKFTIGLFRQTLLEIYRKLRNAQISYDVPLRVSTDQAIWLIEEFGKTRSGGDRILAVAAALFHIIGKYFFLFDPEVKRGKITESDDASGQAADIECNGSGGSIRVAVEVKDRELVVSDIEEKLAATRKKGITEVLFVSSKPSKLDIGIKDVLKREFAAGQNINVLDLSVLTRCVLVLAGENARKDFLSRVGLELDRYSDKKHRLAWREVLSSVASASN